MQITVIIPTYNRYEFLKRALESVFSQTYKIKELIVIDDGSTDNTSQIQDDFPNIKYFYQENKGVSSARNLGIKKSSCEWIAFLDSDDEWHKDKLKLQVEFHQQNRDILISYTDELWIRDNKIVNIPKKFKKFGGKIFKECLSFCIIAPSSTLISKEILNQVHNDGMIFDEELEVCEDYDLWLRIAIENEIGLIDEKLITKYAGHEDQLSFKHWGMDRFRVISLENLLNRFDKIPSQAENDGVFPVTPSFRATTRNLVIATLINKYTLLLKGAKKYDKIADIKIYEKRLRELNE